MGEWNVCLILALSETLWSDSCFGVLSSGMKEPTAIWQKVGLVSQQVWTLQIPGDHNTMKYPRAADFRALWQCNPVVIKVSDLKHLWENTEQKLRQMWKGENQTKKNVTENTVFQLTARNIVLRKLIFPHHVKMFTEFYITLNFITVFTNAHHLSIALTRLIQSMPFYSKSSRSPPSSSKCSLSLGLLHQNHYAPLFSPTRASSLRSHF